MRHARSILDLLWREQVLLKEGKTTWEVDFVNMRRKAKSLLSYFSPRQFIRCVDNRVQLQKLFSRNKYGLTPDAIAMKQGHDDLYK